MDTSKVEASEPEILSDAEEYSIEDLANAVNELELTGVSVGAAEVPVSFTDSMAAQQPELIGQEKPDPFGELQGGEVSVTPLYFGKF